MDPVTHGIAGALLGKGFFSKRQERVAIFAATLGAVFPDVDIFAEAISRDPLGIVKYHRAITHSFVGLPFFAVLLAVLTRALLPWVKRRWPRFHDLESPPLGMLTLIYGVGIASHILLDGMTSFGTRMWFPISRERVAWDLLFIVDFSFTTIILVPQMIAWIYREPAKNRARAWRTWVLFSVGDLLVWLLTRAAGYPFHLWVAGLASVVLAALFFGPATGGWGFQVTRERWCQAGAFAALVYLFACSIAHHEALLRAKAFADQNHIDISRIGALPIPPSWLDWGDAIRSPDGIFQSQFDLRTTGPNVFNFIPDSRPNEYIARAFLLPDVRLYWSFARFPSIISFIEDGHPVVELGENRFQDGRRRGPQPFTYRVVFDDSGNVIEQGWLTNGMLQSSMRRMVPQQPEPGVPAPPAKKSP
jgi:membrane-bound metal-dependent hydrolase YbcI (DUF457 family)